MAYQPSLYLDLDERKREKKGGKAHVAVIIGALLMGRICARIGRSLSQREIDMNTCWLLSKHTYTYVGTIVLLYRHSSIYTSANQYFAGFCDSFFNLTAFLQET